MPDDLVLAVVDAASPRARWAMREYLDELDRRFPDGFDVDGALRDAAPSFTPPAGLFVVGTMGDDVVACGGVHWVDDARGEIKRMWVSESVRGGGVGRRMLTRLEREIAATGRTTAILDTNAVLLEAIAMYQRSGYAPIERYNDNPYAHHWFEKRLPTPDASMRIDRVTLVVPDYDEAISFFVDALGFVLVDDSPSTTDDGRPKRWVVVAPPGGGAGLVLAEADGDAQAAAVGNQTGGRVGFFLRVADFDVQHRRMLEHGVEFREAPRHEPYGTVAVFVDVAGNAWDLLGDA